MTTPPSGLGRGLAAILTGPTISEDDSLRGRFVDSALDSLCARGPLQLCGYVHDMDGDVTVTLRSPDLQGLHPTRAYQLFSAVGATAAGEIGPHEIRVGDLDAMSVVTQSQRARGVFFFGDPHMDEVRRTQLVRFCSVYAPVIHDHDRPPSDDERVHLVLDQKGDDAHAEVTIASETGFGSAASPQEAVAQAALTAVTADAKLVEVGEVRATDGMSAFVVAAGEQGRLATGAATVTAGPNVAAAVAAVRAGRALAV